MVTYLKNNLLVIVIILLTFTIGTLFILFNGADFITIFSYISSISLCVIGLTYIIFAFVYKDHIQTKARNYSAQISFVIQGLVLIGLAVLIYLYRDYSVRTIIGLTLIILPTYQLIFHENKKRFFLNNLWKYIVGIIFILTIDVIINILFIFIGILLILLGFFIIYLLVINYQDEEKQNIITKYFIAYIIQRSSRK